MKYKERDELVKGLRALADFIEDKGIELPISNPHVRLDEYLWDDTKWINGEWATTRTARAKARIAAKAMGKATKEFNNNYLDMTREFGKRVSIRFTVNRATVCERKVVEVIEHPAEIVPAHTKEAWTEEVVEWDCIDPLLAK